MEGSCFKRIKENIRHEVTFTKVIIYIHYMKDHAIVSKFNGIWTPKKALIWWVNIRWK